VQIRSDDESDRINNPSREWQETEPKMPTQQKTAAQDVQPFLRDKITYELQTNLKDSLGEELWLVHHNADLLTAPRKCQQERVWCQNKSRLNTYTLRPFRSTCS